MDRLGFFRDAAKSVEGYKDFLKENGCKEGSDWEHIPLTTKNNYLLKYRTKDLVRNGDFKECALIGSSSGFSKTGTVFWPKRAEDEALYIKTLEEKFIENYSIDKKRTLVIVSLAFGLWIGGMQIACTLRSLAEISKYHITTATTALNLKEGVNILKEFGEFYDQVLWITNPSNINIIYYLLKEEELFLDGRISFPVVGEYFHENFREGTAVKFGHNRDNPFVVWTGYGSADTGDLGIETQATIILRKFFKDNPEYSKNFFDDVDDIPMIFEMSSDAYIEIINGEIVVTKDQFIPLVRYNTSDRGGIIRKSELKKAGIDSKLLDNIGEQVLYVSGRASDAVIFYGTNITISKIKRFFDSLDKDYLYAGLFNIEQKLIKDGVVVFVFHIYTYSGGERYKDKYLKKLIEFLKSQSNEFNAKYDSLSRSVGHDLIEADIKDISQKEISVKHRYV